MVTRRAKGTGSVRKIGNVYYWRITVNGKKIVKRLDAINNKEANLEATRLYIIASAKTQEEVVLFAGRARNIINETNSLLLVNVFKNFVDSPIRPDCLPDAVKRNKLAWSEFMDCIKINNPSAKTMIDITEGDAEAYAISINTMLPNIYNKRIGSLKLIFKVLKRQSGLNENPFDLIKRKTLKTESKKEFTSEQLIKVFQSVDKKYSFSIPHHEDVKILFRVGTYTGMRLKDCCLLETAKINLEKNTIAVKPYKTEKANTRVIIPIHADLRILLENVDKKQKYVMPDLADRYKRNPSGVCRTNNKIIWHAIGETMTVGQLPKRIKGYGFHSLRHSFVSFCANAGVPLAIVQEIVGHNNVAVTHVYSHLSLESLREAVNAIPGDQQIFLSDKKRLEKIKSLLVDKKKLTKIEKEILGLVNRVKI